MQMLDAMRDEMLNVHNDH